MPAVVSLKDVTLKQDRKTVLKDVHLNVEEGDFVYLIGKTGSGKSSLLKALYADLTLSKGAGSITGFDLEKLKNRQIPHLRRQIVVVFKDFKLTVNCIFLPRQYKDITPPFHAKSFSPIVKIGSFFTIFNIC